MNTLEFHQHTAKLKAQHAADLIREAEREMHAARALFALALSEGEVGATADQSNDAEELRGSLVPVWTEISRLARF